MEDFSAALLRQPANSKLQAALLAARGRNHRSLNNYEQAIGSFPPGYISAIDRTVLNACDMDSENQHGVDLSSIQVSWLDQAASSD